MLRSDLLAFVAFHDERNQGGVGNQVDAVGVAVKVLLQDGLGVKDAQVGAQPGGAFVLRAIHGHALPGVRPGQQLEVVGRSGARHRAAVPQPSCKP